MTQDNIPILKIGAVVLRATSQAEFAVRSAPREPRSGGGQRSEGGIAPFNYEILILRPIPKTPGDIPAFVLPRGSRQYQDATGAWHDARDAATGAAHAASLEDFRRAFEREVEEEAGVTPAMLARARVVEMGPLMFQSRSKGVYPIYWFVALLAQADAARVVETTPADATETRFASLDEIRTLAASGDFSAGYIPVIEAALQPLE